MNRYNNNRSQIYYWAMNWIGLPLVTVYVFSMFIYPWIAGSGRWCHVQSVWHYWQSLNVGMLAFASSIAVYNVSRFKENRQRKRNFLAARAFLPEALDEIARYIQSCGSFMADVWQLTAGHRRTMADIYAPELPSQYKEVFRRCISHADPDVGDHLAYILMRLQINHARMNGIARKQNIGEELSQLNNISYICRLGELMALVGNLFEYARNSVEYKHRNLEWKDYRDAYQLLGMSADEYSGLESYTKATIERGRVRDDT